MPLNCILAHDSRRGGRRINEDRVAHWRTSEALLMVLADGLGGHPHGELAAELAVQRFARAFREEAAPRLADPARFLTQVFASAHADILREAGRRGLRDAPRTVLVACAVQNGDAWWTHVGDCRLYLVRRGQVVLRTRDHAVGRHRVLQCLGGVQPPRPPTPSKMRLAEGDVVLLCSDGLWSALEERELGQSLRAASLADAVGALASGAERRAGPQCDNVSVLAMAWSEDA